MNIALIKEVRDRFELGLGDAKAVVEAVEQGVCADIDEAARYVHNQKLAINVRPLIGETTAEAHDRWALARAKDSE